MIDEWTNSLFNYIICFYNLRYNSYDDFSIIEYDITINYTDVINVVLWCSVPVGTPIREH